jgi:hypothetical protein
LGVAGDAPLLADVGIGSAVSAMNKASTADSGDLQPLDGT